MCRAPNSPEYVAFTSAVITTLNASIPSLTDIIVLGPDPTFPDDVSSDFNDTSFDWDQDFSNFNWSSLFDFDLSSFLDSFNDPSSSGRRRMIVELPGDHPEVTAAHVAQPASRAHRRKLSQAAGYYTIQFILVFSSEADATAGAQVAVDIGGSALFRVMPPRHDVFVLCHICYADVTDTLKNRVAQ